MSTKQKNVLVITHGNRTAVINSPVVALTETADLSLEEDSAEGFISSPEVKEAVDPEMTLQGQRVKSTATTTPIVTLTQPDGVTLDDSVTFMAPQDRKDDSSDMTLDSQSDMSGISACLICGDRASGYHYSVFSCEGCKGFFKRSVQKGLSYACKDQGMCFINKFSRNSCQFCRFQKCLSMGMRKDAVREDRSPGGKHRHKRPRLGDDMVLRVQLGEGGNYSGGAGSLEAGGDSVTEDSVRDALVAAKPHLYPKAETAQEKNEAITINELMHYGYLELRYIIEWAKKVPGFSELDMSDQMSLLKSSFMELNVLRLSYRSMHLENKIKFSEDIVLPLDYCETVGFGKELVDGTIDFAQRLKDINLDLTEFCVLNAIVLMYPDAQGIDDKMKIADMQSKYLDCLRRHIATQHPHDTRRFGKILLRLPSLRIISAKASERFLSMTVDGSIQLNELVLEMMN